jgi:hypothetical protein
MLISFNQNQLAVSKGGFERFVAVIVGLAGAVCGNEQSSDLWREDTNGCGAGFTVPV